MSEVEVVGNDTAAVYDSSGNVDQVFVICDDCRAAYLEPAYYTFEVDACKESIEEDGFVGLHQDCTGNLCPDCADMLIPDDPQDPRATAAVRQEAKDMGF